MIVGARRPSRAAIAATRPPSSWRQPPGPDDDDGLGELHPMGRVGEISDVVRAIMYLESAPFVTGEFLHVDGGQSAGH